MIAAEPEKPKRAIVQIVKHLQRSVPICPRCERVMHRNGRAGMTVYYRCPTCDARAKSRDRIV